ncbi:MAG: MATE family efflux transporter, partial [Rhodobacteraceae bacterium]|nr:MATE family efflux transporter [Paracoccaceae bacterium]
DVYKRQVVLAATLLGAGANVVFNYAFIFGNFGAPEMGAEGAAMASLLTTGLACLFLVVYAGIGKDFKSFDLFRNPLRPDWPAFKEVFRLGAPIGLTMLAESGLFSGSAILVGWFGTIPLAAHGIVIQIAAIAFMIPLGVSNVATIRSGRALGRKSISDLKRSSVVVLIMGLLISSFTITCYLLFPNELVALFMNANAADTQQIVEIGVGLVMVAAAFQLVDSMQVIALGLLRGVKDTTAPMVIAVIAYWGLGMPGGYILGFHLGFGAQGVWMGLVIGLGFAAVVLLWRYWVMLGRITARLQGNL